MDDLGAVFRRIIDCAARDYATADCMLDAQALAAFAEAKLPAILAAADKAKADNVPAYVKTSVRRLVKRHAGQHRLPEDAATPERLRTLADARDFAEWRRRRRDEDGFSRDDALELVAQLPALEQRAVRMTFGFGCHAVPIGGVAKQLGMTVMGAEMIVKRGLELLRELLQAESVS